jgi:hypothetical protein
MALPSIGADFFTSTQPKHSYKCLLDGVHYGDRDHQCRIHTSTLVRCLDMVFKEAKSLLPSPSWTWVFSSFIKSGKVSSKIVVLKTSN